MLKPAAAHANVLRVAASCRKGWSRAIPFERENRLLTHSRLIAHARLIRLRTDQGIDYRGGPL